MTKVYFATCEACLLHIAIDVILIHSVVDIVHSIGLRYLRYKGRLKAFGLTMKVLILIFFLQN